MVLYEFDDAFWPQQALAKAAEQAIAAIINEYGAESSILLIGRYHFDGEKLCRSGRFSKLAASDDQGLPIQSVKFPTAKLTFMTAHGAKGLGFDSVIILNAFEGKFGFPCQLEDDPIMQLVQFADTSIPFAEERRLFYVALTRTKNRLYILTPQTRPSRFVVELINDYQIPHSENINLETRKTFRLRCPICDYPLKNELNKNYGLRLYICTNEPEICDFMANNQDHLHDIYKCAKCADGYMIVKVGQKGAFFGCTEYERIGCANTEQIVKPSLLGKLWQQFGRFMNRPYT